MRDVMMSIQALNCESFLSVQVSRTERGALMGMATGLIFLICSQERKFNTLDLFVQELWPIITSRDILAIPLSKFLALQTVLLRFQASGGSCVDGIQDFRPFYQTMPWLSINSFILFKLINCSEIRDQAKKSLPERPNVILVHEGQRICI